MGDGEGKSFGRDAQNNPLDAVLPHFKLIKPL